MKSPLTIGYNDLLSLAEEVLKERESRYKGAQDRGITNFNALTHQVETARLLVRMLKKGKPVKQTDLFALFNETVK